jgi:hypothetical protein
MPLPGSSSSSSRLSVGFPRIAVPENHGPGLTFSETGINAFVYMTAARVVYYAVDDQSVWRIKATWLTQIFVWIDAVCFIIQAGGGILMSNDGTESDRKLIDIGKKIYMAGCGAQLGFIIVFIGLMVRVYMKMRATPSLEANMSRAMLLFWALIGVLLFIVVSVQTPMFIINTKLTCNH